MKCLNTAYSFCFRKTGETSIVGDSAATNFGSLRAAIIKSAGACVNLGLAIMVAGFGC